MDVSPADLEPTSGRRRALAGGRPSLRVGVGAVVVLVLVAVAAAVVVAAVTPQGVETQATPPAVVHTVTGAGGGDDPQGSGSSGASTTTVYIDVTGAVAAPGLYRLAAGQRVVDAIAAAGGFTAHADQAGVNLARPVEDGEQIVVPQQGATAPTVGVGVGGGGKVDLNTADESALETLDGVGPALAERILSYRKAHGSFRTIKDLLNVAGIGDKKFAAIKDAVTT